MSICARPLARLVLTGAAIVSTVAPVLAQSGNVNVYTYRERGLIQPIFDIFTKETGIKVNVISAGSGLEQRIKTEGSNSPADVLLTVNMGGFKDAARPGTTKEVRSVFLEKAIP